MTNIIRWDPFREMQTFRNTMDRFMEESQWGTASPVWRRGEGFPLSLDVAEDEKAYIVKASIPGVDPEAIDITLTDNVVTIKGETKQEQESDEKNYHVRERRYGSFMRSIMLPTAVDADKIEATHEHGVLTLHVPKTEAAHPKRISVKRTVNGNGRTNSENTP